MLRLLTFGGLSMAEAGGGAAGRGGQRKRLALLAMLAFHRHRPVSREKLLGYFWPERPSAEGRHTLAQLIYAIRQEFGDSVLVSGADDVRTDPAGFSADVIDFMAACDRGDLEAAARYYAGPFLDGFYLNDTPEFERWVELVRSQLATQCSTTLEALARAAAAAGCEDEATAWWRKRAALDPLSSSVALELMRALTASGDIAGALRHAELHAAQRHAGLDAPPDPRVVAFARQVRETAAAAPLPPPRPAVAQPELRPPNRPSRFRLRAWHIATVLLLTGAAAIILRSHPPAAPPAAPRLVVLGAIESPDVNLALAVREALRSGLEADSTIRVLSETRIHETLRLMAQPADTRLSSSVATEIALRRGAAFAVVGSAVPVGNGIAIVVRTLDPRSGEALKTLSEHAARPTEVIPALTRIREGIRREVVGSPGSAQLAPLPPVMTASLQALQDYAMAREALRQFDRDRALRLAEAALGEDSMFPMANYLVGDLDWFFDRQRAAERHLSRARSQADRLPLKERLLVEARYQELVADHSDSALIVWQQLREAFPDDGLAYDGMAWTFRALGRFSEAAVAAHTALHLDSTTFAPSASNEIYALLDMGDTTQARDFVREHLPAMSGVYRAQVEFFAALLARDWPRALSVFPDTGGPVSDPYHHVALLLNGHLPEAAVVLQRIRRLFPHHQFLPRAISLQARAELAQGAPTDQSDLSARDVLAWLQTADLSAAATARLCERAAELAARAGDPAAIVSARRLLERRDSGQHLPSLRLALSTVEAASAFARRDYSRAAHLALAARAGTFHGRSLALAALLEADARAALGDTAAARQLYRRLLIPGEFAAGDIETWAVLNSEVARKLRRLDGVAAAGRPGSARSGRPIPPT